jgi:hypothetical protein
VITQLLNLQKSCGNGGVMGQDMRGKFQVSQRVLVCAVHRGLGRQIGQALQRGIHLLGAALKQSAASGGKERVTTKQHGQGVATKTKIGNVPQRMARHLNHGETTVERINFYNITFAQTGVYTGNIFTVWTINRQRPRGVELGGPFNQRRDATHMITVVVGD